MLRATTLSLLTLLLLLLRVPAKKTKEVSFEDDDVDAVQRLRGRLTSMGEDASRKLGIVLTVGPKETSYAELTIPLWRAYCEKHQMGFFLQEEALGIDLPFEWTRPRVLLEVLQRLRWDYVLVVEPSSLPANFGRSWRHLIDTYMRFKRYANDKVKNRLIFYPWDCDEEYDDPHNGGCHAPMLSGGIYWARKAETLDLVQSWYNKRRLRDVPADSTGPLRAMKKLKDRHYEEVFYKDIADHVGRKTSKSIATFTWEKEYGWNLRDQIYEYILRSKELSRAAKEAAAKDEL